MAFEAIQHLFDLIEKRSEIDQEIRTMKKTGAYVQALHELVDAAPEAVSINHRLARRFMKDPMPAPKKY